MVMGARLGWRKLGVTVDIDGNVQCTREVWLIGIRSDYRLSDCPLDTLSRRTSIVIKVTPRSSDRTLRSRMPSILKISRSLLGKLTVSSRKFARNLPPPERKKPSISKCYRFMYNWSGFNRYGLYSDDLLDYNSPIIIEALRRLPEDELDARNFRIIRAMNLDFLGIQLPREEWLTIEQDVEYRYLRKHIKEVLAEIQEIHDSGDPNYTIDDYWPHNDPK